jgi:hypothetical protein
LDPALERGGFGFPLGSIRAAEGGKSGVTSMETPEKQTTTLGTALLFTNLGLPIAGAYFCFFKVFPLHIVIESFCIAFVLLNLYLLIAFKIWGSKPK